MNIELCIVALVRSLPHGIQPDSNGRVRVTDVGPAWGSDRLRTLLHDGRPVAEVRSEIGDCPTVGRLKLFSRDDGEALRQARREQFRQSARTAEADRIAILAHLRAGGGARFTPGQCGGTLSIERADSTNGRRWASAPGCVRTLRAKLDPRIEARMERNDQSAALVYYRGSQLTRRAPCSWLGRLLQSAAARAQGAEQ